MPQRGDKIIRAAIFCTTLIAFSSNGYAGNHSRKIAALIEKVTTAMPSDQETCFSPNEPCDVKLAKFLGSAQRAIDIAIYDINLDQLVHQILVQNKKVQVRIIVDKRQAKGGHSSVPFLIKAGVKLRFGHQRGIMHDKFTIVDNNMVETGSFNYTHHAATANQENQIYLANPEVVERYQDRFNKMWEEAAPPDL